MRIFISHSSHDAKIATAVCSALETSGYSCFIAPRDIKAGKGYAEEIVNGIDGSDILLLLLSVRSNRSPHVLREVERAGSRRIPIMVYKLEEVALTKSLEYFLMTNQWIDGTDDYHCSKVLEAFKNLPDPRGERSSQEKRETGTGQTVNNVNVNNADRKKQTVNSPKEPNKTERRTDSGKQIVLVLLILLILLMVCGVFVLAMRVWRGTKGTVFKGTVIKSMTQGTENIDLSLGERENAVYEDQAPASSAMSEKKNGYSNEEGFLHGFTKEGSDVLRETENFTWENILIMSSKK